MYIKTNYEIMFEKAGENEWYGDRHHQIRFVALVLE